MAADTVAAGADAAIVLADAPGSTVAPLFCAGALRAEEDRVFAGRGVAETLGAAASTLAGAGAAAACFAVVDLVRGLRAAGVLAGASAAAFVGRDRFGLPPAGGRVCGSPAGAAVAAVSAGPGNGSLAAMVVGEAAGAAVEGSGVSPEVAAIVS
ncbi:MAG: hypothetical protein ACTHOR_03150 [Devosia sp.]